MLPSEAAMDLHPSILALIPKTEVAQTALLKAFTALSTSIFNHSLRTYLLARWLAEKEGSEWAEPQNLSLLFTACICHDLGTSDEYNGKQRFEVEGADAAMDHLRQHNCDPSDAHKVWVAIAIHASPGIAERIDPLARIVRLGVKIDFHPATRDEFQAQEYAKEVEHYLPRLEIERNLSNAVVKQAAKIPLKVDRMTWPDSEKHPKASWSGILLHAYALNPHYEGVNPAF